MPTTGPAPFDVAAIFPALASLRRTGVRLHPRRAHEDPDVAASKMGGVLAWPLDEPWPGEAENDPFVRVLQLLRNDVPELPFPEGRDLFQLAWLPRDPTGNGPRMHGAWRTSTAMGRTRATMPAPRAPDRDLVPQPCTLAPERVVELPDVFALPPDLREAIARWELDEHDGKPVYQYLCSTAPGTKVGGHPDWIQDPETPSCERCGSETSYLLTIASAEFDGGTWPRWMCNEERHLWRGPYEPRNAVQRAAGLMLGDMGDVYVHVCRRCDDWPVTGVLQCS